ncbi:plasmid mobilization protein [Rhizosphaericola mali]|uniref:Uncharacterized protein n=1 Tax=Rhizosphaericola mali TaxID=2545455 RepID=A0A5P2G9S4_9BACT|nr:hypothetical protein [Rhizosphaericola mali]QES91059.1 hypothetical protein E0W69_020310 [Rhizosphaericola mali]
MYRHLRKDGEVAMFAVVDQAIKTEVALKYPGVINVWTQLDAIMGGKRSEFEDYLNELGDAYRIKLASEKHNKEFEEIKEVRMAIRMKEREYERLEVMAKEKGVKVSSLCRNILGNTALENVHIDGQLKRSFLGMGVNLNQLAYHYNRTGENPPAELKECLELLKLFRDAYSRK